MRRAAPAIIATVIGLGALASFKTTHASRLTTKPISGVTRPPTAGAPPSSGAGSGGTATPSATSGTTAPASTAPAAASGATRTIDGDPVDNRFGTVQVRVTLQGKAITAIEALQMPYDHARSAYISQQAEPMLRQEALQAQSAQIDIIGGATYTSESYAQSLQSALDKAHA